MAGLMATQSSTDLPGDFDVEQNDIARRRLLVQALSQQNAMPEAHMVSGHYVAPGWAGALLKALQGGVSGWQQGELTKEERALAGRRQAAASDFLSSMPQDRPATPAVPGYSLPPDQQGPVQDAQVAQPGGPPSRSDMARWAVRGAGISPLTNKVAEGAVAKMTAGPNYKFEMGFDDKGREVKYVIDGNTGQKLGTLGGPKSFEPTNQQKNIEDIKARFGVDDKTAATIAYNLMKEVPLTAGGSMASVNTADMLGLGGGSGTSTMPGAPKAAPQPPMPMNNTATGQAPGPGGAQVPAKPAGPYAGPVIGSPAVKVLVQGTGAQQDLADKVKAYGDEYRKNGIPQLDTALKRIEDRIAEYGNKSIPGVGYAANIPITQLFNQEGQDTQAMLSQVRGMKLTAEAGKSQTASEVAQILREMGTSPMQSEQTFRTQIPRLRQALERVKAEVDATFHPSVVQAYKANQSGGTMTAEELAAEIRKAQGGQ